RRRRRVGAEQKIRVLAGQVRNCQLYVVERPMLQALIHRRVRGIAVIDFLLEPLPSGLLNHATISVGTTFGIAGQLHILSVEIRTKPRENLNRSLITNSLFYNLI